MTETDVKRLGLILAVQAEIEGMKAENMQRTACNESTSYNSYDFQAKAEEIRNVVHCNDLQL